MLSLSETFSTTLSLSANESIQCDLALSEGVLKACPKEAPALYEIICDVFPKLWPVLTQQISENPWLISNQNQQQHLTFGVIIVDNPEIHALNRSYRAKDTATDVLTFTMTEAEAMATHLPELHLGEIYISLSWAIDNACNENDAKLNFQSPLSLFILERLLHGCLHILGVHHESMSDYNKVVTIQRTVLNALSP